MTQTLSVGPAQGDLLVHTKAEGPAGVLGHDLTLRFRDWSCRAEVEGMTAQSVALAFDLSSLEVVRGEGGAKPLSDRDKRNILSSAAKTLGSPPDALFKSTAVTDSAIDGQLTLHRVTRSISVPLTIAEEGPSFRITARLAIRQSEFGIKPYSQMLGALQVADVVQVRLEVVVPAP